MILARICLAVGIANIALAVFVFVETRIVISSAVCGPWCVFLYFMQRPQAT